MIKLSLPKDCKDYKKVLDACTNNINITHQNVKEKNLCYKHKIEQNKDYLIRISKVYIKWGQANLLFKYRDYKLENNNPIIGNKSEIELLTNTDMTTLYSIYLVAKRSGNFYDKILNYAKNPNIRCPFCGGIGEPNELDHFLPKSGFGYYSIFPYNLIPICKDCNQKYKNEFYPTQKNEQLIHPYLDDDCFFNEQWIFAEIIIDDNDINSISARFYVNPPNNWSEDKKGKVQFHFEKFELGRRYAIHSNSELFTLICQIIESKNSFNIDQQVFLGCMIDPIIKNNKANNWKKVLYEAVKQKLADIWHIA